MARTASGPGVRATPGRAAPAAKGPPREDVEHAGRVSALTPVPLGARRDQSGGATLPTFLSSRLTYHAERRSPPTPSCHPERSEERAKSRDLGQEECRPDHQRWVVAHERMPRSLHSARKLASVGMTEG